eukprot:351773-Chlamydomonas_euryale.AAC.1
MPSLVGALHALQGSHLAPTLDCSFHAPSSSVSGTVRLLPSVSHCVAFAADSRGSCASVQLCMQLYSCVLRVVACHDAGL